MKLRSGRRLLVYENQVAVSEIRAEASFERDLIPALRQRARRLGVGFKLFSIRRPGGPRVDRDYPNATILLVDKTHHLGYLAHQARLGWRLLLLLLVHWRDEVAISSRYSDSSIAPAILAWLFRRRLVFRTGPTPANLQLYKPNEPALVLKSVRLAFGLNCRVASTVVVGTARCKAYLEELYPWMHGKIRVVHNGVNLERFPVGTTPERARWGLRESGLVLGFVGRILESYELNTVLQAMAEVLRETGSIPQLLIVGDGPMRATWQDLALRLGLDGYVVWAGAVPHEEVASAITACDITLTPHTRAGLADHGSSSIKLFEYLACDRFILATRHDDHRFLEEAAVGRLIEPEDVQAWAEAIRDIMTAPPPPLAGRGRRLVELGYTYDLIAEEIWSACFPEDGDQRMLGAQAAPQRTIAVSRTEAGGGVDA